MSNLNLKNIDDIKVNSTFTFKNVSKDNVGAIVKNLDLVKASKSNDIPIRILKIISLTSCWILLPAAIYLLKVNIRNTRERCKICSKLIIKTPERRRHLWTYFTLSSSVSIVNFAHVFAGWASKILTPILKYWLTSTEIVSIYKKKDK